MANNPIRIYWDSCVYIDCIRGTEGRKDLLRSMVEEAKQGRILFVASPLVIAEVCKLKEDGLSRADEAKKIRDFFENDYIKVRELDRLLAEEAAEVARVHGISSSDAVHVVTALKWEVKYFQTYDGLKGCRSKLLAHDGRIGTPPLTIELPRMRTESVQNHPSFNFRD